MLTIISAGRRSAVISAFIFMFITFSGVLYAESVFLKDGSIVEGTIIKETDDKIVIQSETGAVENISRTDILRALYHGKYKDKKTLNMIDRTKIEGYIVEENENNYIIRKELNSADEITISKDDIDNISRYKPKDSKEVVYNGNGSTEGKVPFDKNFYMTEQKITVLDNTGNLSKRGYTFNGWNTQPDGKGTNYPPGKTLSMGVSDIILYVDWIPVSAKPEYDVPAAYYLCGIIPGAGQYYSGHYIKGTFFLASFAGSVSWAVYANMKYKKSRDDYQSMTAEHTAKEFKEANDKANIDGKMALYSIITASSMYILNWLDILIFSRPESLNSAGNLQSGETYFSFDILPENNNLYFNQNSTDLKVEAGISLRF